MHATQLNSGSFKNLTPIGEDGSPVWRNAAAFRSAIEREPKLGRAYANFLAEPRFNENADHVDWYVPFPPTRQDGEYLIVSWQSASPQEKSAALKKLSEFETRMQDFGYDLEARSLDSNNLLFAHYLTGRGHAENLPALHFPDENCLFIVDGQPVITFWGFVKNERTLATSPFAALRPQVRGAGGAGAAPAAAAAAATAAGSKSHLWCYLLPLLLLLLLLLLWWLWQRLYAPQLPLFSVRPDLGNFSLEPVVQTLTTDQEEQEELQRIIDKTYGRVVVDDPYAVAKGVVGTGGTVSPETAIPANGEAETALSGTLPELKPEDQAAAVPQEEPAAADNLNATEPQAPHAEENKAEETKADGTLPESPDPAAKEQQATEEPVKEAEAQPQDQGTAQDGKPAGKEQPAAEQGQAADPASQEQQGAVPPPELQQQKAQDGQSGQSLKLNQADVNAQNLKVLDGSWASRSGLVDAKTGKPVNVQYAFKDGKGTATVTRSDGSKCVTEINGSFKGGALNIDNAGLAKCADGSGYSLPKVTCKPDKDGKTSCVGSYNNDQEQVNIQLYR